MLPLPKRHHTVPQLYLRRFAVDDCVVLANKHTGALSTPRVGDALVRKHFYSVDMPDGSRNPAVERMLADHVEGPATRTLKRLIDDRRSLSFLGLRERLSVFLAFQLIRGEAPRRAQAEFMAALMRQTVELTPSEAYRRFLREVEGNEPSDEEVQSLVAFARDPSRYEIKIEHESSMHIDFMLRNVPTLVPFFLRRTWQVVALCEPVLLTGDEPIALADNSDEPGAVGGLARADRIIFPTDPRHALVMLHPALGAQQRWVSGTSEQAASFNRHVAFACHEYLVHMPGTSPLNGLEIPEKAAAVETLGPFTMMRRNRGPRRSQVLV